MAEIQGSPAGDDPMVCIAAVWHIMLSSAFKCFFAIFSLISMFLTWIDLIDGCLIMWVRARELSSRDFVAYTIILLYFFTWKQYSNTLIVTGPLRVTII